MTNSADPDQLASSTTDLDLHCLLRQGMSCTAREGLNWSQSFEPALMAQLDMHPTDDQEVVGLIPTGLASLSWRFDHEIFSTVILSLLLIQEKLSVSGEKMCTILVNHLED